MTRIPNFAEDPIEYLVRHKFPLPRQSVEDILANRHTPITRESLELPPEASAYRVELLQKTPEELRALCLAVIREKEEAQQKAAQLRLEAEEKQRFFNRPNAYADFVHWSKAAYWRLDEATALSFGRNPAIVNWEAIKGWVQASPFVAEYARVRDLVIRARDFKQLYEPVPPGFFIAWARRMDIAFPDKLEEQVKVRGGNIMDWKTAYDTALEEHDKYVKTAQAQMQQSLAQTEAAVNQVVVLRQECSTLQAKLAEAESVKNPAPEKPLKTRERDTLLKLLIGMAVKGYRYNPKASKNPAVSDIASDLEQLGIALSDDTIRKWLGEAAQLLELEGAETQD
jgi:hypothetical protein